MRKIIRSNCKDLQFLLSNSNNGLKSFRYFNKRPIDIINNQLLSLIVKEDDIPIAYCHLEEEGGTYWIGVLVSDDYVNKKIGSYCVDILTKVSDALGITDICLSVDCDNKSAIFLYQKFNFEIIKENNTSFLMKRKARF